MTRKLVWPLLAANLLLVLLIGVYDVAAFGPPLFSACTAPSSSKHVVFGVPRSVRPNSPFRSPFRCTQSRIKTIMLSLKDEEEDEEEVEGGELTTETDWGGALAEVGV